MVYCNQHLPVVKLQLLLIFHLIPGPLGRTPILSLEYTVRIIHTNMQYGWSFSTILRKIQSDGHLMWFLYRSQNNYLWFEFWWEKITLLMHVLIKINLRINVMMLIDYLDESVTISFALSFMQKMRTVFLCPFIFHLMKMFCYLIKSCLTTVWRTRILSSCLFFIQRSNKGLSLNSKASSLLLLELNLLMFLFRNVKVYNLNYLFSIS